jgi:mono/diheme cytochrome c family protein
MIGFVGGARRRSVLSGPFCVLLLVLCVLAAVPAAAQEQSRGNVGHDKNSAAGIETNDEMQPTKLPALPNGVTLDLIRAGDSLFHGKGGCFACHGSEGEGMPGAGDAITVAFNYAQQDPHSIDSLVTAGIPDALTRSPIAMPPRGARSNLTDDEISRIAAYVWAINQVRGEPWPGGHADHRAFNPPTTLLSTQPPSSSTAHAAGRGRR